MMKSSIVKSFRIAGSLRQLWICVLVAGFVGDCCIAAAQNAANVRPSGDAITEYSIHSPSQTVEAKLQFSVAAELTYDVRFNGLQVVEPSRLGITVNGETWAATLKSVGLK